MHPICHIGDFTPKRRREGTRIPIDLQAKRRSAWHRLRCDINIGSGAGISGGTVGDWLDWDVLGIFLLR